MRNQHFLLDVMQHVTVGRELFGTVSRLPSLKHFYLRSLLLHVASGDMTCCYGKNQVATPHTQTSYWSVIGQSNFAYPHVWFS